MPFALRLCFVQFVAEIFDDKFLAIRCVFAHVIFQDIIDTGMILDQDWFEMDLLPDKGTKFIR